MPAALDDLTAELVPEERVAVLAEERVAVPPALALERTVLLPAERVALELAALLERVVPEPTELLRVALLLELDALLLTVPPTDLEVVAEERDTPELELEREAPEL